MKTKEFFMRSEEYARMKAVLFLIAIIFVIGLVTESYGTDVGLMYLLGIFGTFAVISVGLIYHYREEPEALEEVDRPEPEEQKKSSESGEDPEEE